MVPEQPDLLKWIFTENDAFKLRSNYSNLLTKTSTLEEFSAFDQGFCLCKPQALASNLPTYTEVSFLKS
jgi:hypothetical protein